MVKRLLFIFFLVAVFSLGNIVSPSSSSAQACTPGASATCQGTRRVCTDPSGASCNELVDPACTCTNQLQTYPTACNDTTLACTPGVCFAGDTYIGGCSPAAPPTPAGCQSNAACGANRQCCSGESGNPNYCSNTCYSCGGAYICAPPATPTPTDSCPGLCAGSTNPGGTCTSPSGPGTYAWDNAGANTSCHNSPNLYCYTCVANPTITLTPTPSNTPTPTPSVSPTPTPLVCPGGPGNACSSSGSCGAGQSCIGGCCVVAPPDSCPSGQHADSVACGSCCANGTTCTAGFNPFTSTVTYACQAPTGGGGNTCPIAPTTIEVSGRAVQDTDHDFVASAFDTEVGGGTLSLADLSGSISQFIGSYLFPDRPYGGQQTFNFAKTYNAFPYKGLFVSTMRYTPSPPCIAFISYFLPTITTLTNIGAGSLVPPLYSVIGVSPMFDAPYTIYGRVYQDTNKNGAFDDECVDANNNNVCDVGEVNCTSHLPNGACAGRVRVMPEPGASVPLKAFSTTDATITSNVTSLGDGSFEIPFTNPGNYTVSPNLASTTYAIEPGTPASRTVTLGPFNAFGTDFRVVPLGNACTSLTANPPVVNSGATSQLTATCTGTPPDYLWPPVDPPTCGSVLNTNSPITTFTAQSGVCDPITCTVSVQATSGTSVSARSTTITVNPANKIVGRLIMDANNDNCETSNVGKPTTTVQITDGSSVTVSATSDSSGNYTITDNFTCSVARHMSVPGETIKKVRLFNSTWTSAGIVAGTDYVIPPNSTALNTIDFCLEGASPWFQTTSGDVRFVNLINSLPAGAKATDDTVNPSVFFSSNSNPDFGLGTASSCPGGLCNWQVGREYSYSKQFAKGKGGVSYDFYMAKAKQQNISITTISDANVNLADIAQSGVYQLTADNPTLFSSVDSLPAPIAGNKHLIILAQNDVTISGNLNVNTGALLIVAAKEDITIDPSVGTTATDNINTQLDGYYSAQGNITLSHNNAATCSPTSDKRLNVGGALIANSVYPFETGGSGRVINQRTLCSADATSPVLKVFQRFDFLTQLTDFYKTTYKTFREVQP